MNFPKKTGKTTTKDITQMTGSKDKAPAVYFHPENDQLGWSGKGRAPDWLKDLLGVEKVSKNDPEIAEKLEKLKK